MNQNKPKNLFSQTVNQITYYLLHTNDNIDVNNNFDLFNYYKELLRLRHDVLNYFILKMLGLDWSDETTFADTLDIIDDNPILLRTPDIALYRNFIHYFIDVSVSYDIVKTSNTKSSKYNEVINYLRKKHNIICEFVHINCFTGLNNLPTEIMKLNSITLEDFDNLSFYNCVDIINTKKDWISQYIDKDFFELEKIKEFTLEKNPEIIGKYTDVAINSLEFDNFNKKYDHLNLIKSSCKAFCFR